MSMAKFEVPEPFNEPILDYEPGSPERASLQARIAAMKAEEIEIPMRIGGADVTSGQMADCRSPHAHGTLLARYHQGDATHVQQAIDAANAAAPAWRVMPWEQRVSIFLKAADLLAGPWRDTLNAATILGQSKTCHQAEIDAACELIDFLRFNVLYAQDIYEDQPISGPGCWNRVEYRPLEGFVFAVTPFNFTAIAGNLPTAPAMLGNTVVWKPASSAVYSAHFVMQLLEEAGLPAGVINMVPGSGRTIGDPALASEHLAGIHFTGSTPVFQGMWKTVGNNIQKYRTYPRIVGETGGKDFIIAHPSADRDALRTAIIRGAFEYQGQKCSAASRAYVPRSIWSEIKGDLIADAESITMGSPEDFSNYMGAVIDRAAFTTIKEYIDHARDADDAEIICGGECDDSVGYFIRPTIIEAKNHDFRSMCEEIFGPVITIWVYEDADWKDALAKVDSTSPYALTGSVFAQCRYAVVEATEALTHAAGNFYINDKPSGAVVGQQPFGGSRASGTNDKAGSALNLQRWLSLRTIKETFVPPTDYRYPYQG